MKKRISLATAVAALFSISAMAAELKVGTELQLRYTAGFNPNSITTPILGSIFSVERGYITLEPILSDTVKGRFTMDFAVPADKNAVQTKFKYAWIQIDNLVPDSSLAFGWIKHYMGLVYDWNYDFIDKQLGDKYKFYKSADAGIVFSGFLPEGLGEYGVWVVNGEGYEKIGSDLDLVPELGLNVRFIPIQGVTVGVSACYIHSGSKAAYNLSDGLEIITLNPTLQLAYGPFSLVGEYIYSQFPKTAPGMAVPGDPVTAALNTKTATAPATAVNMWHAVSGMARADISKLVDGLDMDAGLMYNYLVKNPNDTTTNASGQVRSDSKFDITAQVNYNLARDDKNVPLATAQLAYVASFTPGAGNYGIGISAHAIQFQIKAKIGKTIK